MAIFNFLLACRKCAEKYKDWEKCGLCNIHNNENGTLIFTCFNCGKEELFVPDRTKKTTKKQALLCREKRELEQKINELIN